MIQLSFDVDDITLVLQQYDRIKVYRSTSSAGPWNEITDVNTRIIIIPERTVYYFIDPTGVVNHWYHTTYFKEPAGPESPPSIVLQGGTSTEKLGYSFDNYSPPTGEWGEVLTAGDMRYTYLFGIDSVAGNAARDEWTNEQYKYLVRAAVADFEKYLSIDIRKRVYLTRPAGTLIRGRLWREGVDYTDEEDPYDFQPELWRNYGFVQLRHYPLISVERAILYSPVRTEVMDLKTQGWLRLHKKFGQLNLFPATGLNYGPYAVGALPWRMLGSAYPQGLEFDYTTGFVNSDFVPDDLREVIGKWAAIKSLAIIGDALLPGFSSQSVSLDGLSESFSSTQSATNAYFGARILQYAKEIKDWLTQNKGKYSIPLAFVGV